MSERDKNELADEYVLGLLEEHERSVVETVLKTDKELQIAVARSRDRFVELDLSLPPAELPGDLWSRIDRAIDESGQQAQNERRSYDRKSLAANDNNVQAYRRLAFAGLAASLLLAATLFMNLLFSTPPTIIAVLLNDQGQPVAIVEDFADTNARLVMLSNVTVPPSRSLQVWTKPSEELGPVSMGVLKSSSTTVLSRSDLPVPQEAQLYEITIEPAGGSPTGLPTGPIVAKGFAKIPL